MGMQAIDRILQAEMIDHYLHVQFGVDERLNLRLYNPDCLIVNIF